MPTCWPVKTVKQEIKDTPIEKLRNHPRNPRKGNAAKIMRSIRANGFYGVIVAQKSTGYVLAGNHRLMAARKAGAKSLPVAWIDVDDERALRILLADNKISDESGTDETRLAELLSELADTDIGLRGTGYDEGEIDDLIEDIAGESDPQLGGLEFRVVVDCNNEEHQAELLARFEAEGLPCRALMS